MKQFEQLMSFWKEIEKKEIDADAFVKKVIEHEISSKKIRKLEALYAIKDNPEQQRKGSKLLRGSRSKSDGRKDSRSAPTKPDIKQLSQ